VTAHASKDPIASTREAELAISDLNNIMDRLEATVSEETARLRAGKLRAARELEESKSELTRLYAAQSERLKAASNLLARSLPEAIEALRKRHTAFQSLLQGNLTVLATAHAVSEGIIRGVSGELARRQTPTTYGASGRANAPSPKASQPLAFSRTL
jgi:hypothetical protein